ncbi:hypothetical protein [Streptomyces phaeochromogenes]
MPWDNPGAKKLGNQCSQTERWWRIQDALYSQTCGALHNDAVTKTFTYDRTEAETLLAMTAALLRNVPGLPGRVSDRQQTTAEHGVGPDPYSHVFWSIRHEALAPPTRALPAPRW